MRRLPPLQTGSVRRTLPMADRSAMVLAETILDNNRHRATSLLTEQLVGDPPLVLWTLTMAANREPGRAKSLADLADWLLRHGVRAWQRNSQCEQNPQSIDPQSIDPLDTADPRAEHYADLVAERLRLADMAALCAAPDGQLASELAYLAGLVFEPEKWLAIVSADESTASVPRPSGWGKFDSTATEYVTQALDVLDGKSPDTHIEFDLEACRHRAEAGRRAWLESLTGQPGAGLVDRFESLMARLARLEALESQFQETLETEKLAAMAEFAAGAGHEINNPLAIIGGRAQLLLQEETDPQRRRELAVMNAQARRAHEMIADMRLFARPPRPEPEPVDLVELIDGLIADLLPELTSNAITLQRVGLPGPVEIEADPTQLQVALRAMCKNAAEAIGHGGRIELGLGRRRGGDIEIRVSDNGPGISAEQRRHLFDPFYSARQAGRGLGLGLSKCWRIVTGHGGLIEVASQPDQGAVLTVILPCKFSG